LTRAENAGSLAGMSNVLGNEKQQQIRALGRLGWTLSRIQEATGIRRETISGYLKAAGIAVRSRGRPSESKAKPAISEEVSTDSSEAKPATRMEVSTDSAPVPRPRWAPSASACEPSAVGIQRKEPTLPGAGRRAAARDRRARRGGRSATGETMIRWPCSGCQR
jgi:hypothetical protein